MSSIFQAETRTASHITGSHGDGDSIAAQGTVVSIATTEPRIRGSATPIAQVASPSRNVSFLIISGPEAEDVASATPGLAIPTRPSPDLRDEFVGTWDMVRYVDARIVEVHKDWIRLDCLVDRKERVFQERIFERTLLEGIATIRVGAYIFIKIAQRAGKLMFTFADGERFVRKEAFEDDFSFSDLEDSGLGDPL